MTREQEYQNALNGYMNLDVHINKTLRLIGISDIKKQIPKKPLEDRMIQTGYWDCPICRHLVDMSANYCEHCGQALDWSEEDD